MEDGGTTEITSGVTDSGLSEFDSVAGSPRSGESRPGSLTWDEGFERRAASLQAVLPDRRRRQAISVAVFSHAAKANFNPHSGNGYASM